MTACKLCGCNHIHVTYEGLIRDGALGVYTKDAVKMYQCDECGVIWHEATKNLNEYYESSEYRESLEGTVDAETFYKNHDKESLQKFMMTGTERFRGKNVADIGCGAGAFLDYINGVAKNVIAIEPTAEYRNIIKNKGYNTYAYAKDAQKDWQNKVDVITSFDVIEHVENPLEFMNDAYALMRRGGVSIIGTPTDAPIMRSLLGNIYEQKVLFSTQHLWVFGAKSLEYIAQKAGFTNVSVKYFQRYSVGNFLGWIRQKEPRSEITSAVISEYLDAAWKAHCNEKGFSDYIVLYAEK